ncbi:MAG TPA: site-specific integrase, partial [Polyangiaceae bacterium]
MTTSKGGRPATGAIKWMRNAKTGAVHWHGRVTLPDGRRPWAPLDPSIPGDDEARAKACAVETAAWFRTHPLVGDEVKETCDEWWARFHKHKATQGLATVAEMKGRYRKWIAPDLACVDPRAVARTHLEAIVRRLDRAVVAWTKAGGKRGSGISPSTAANVWGDVTHAFDEMIRSKEPSLRVLTVNPCDAVRGPDAGGDRQGQVVYSDELVALLRGVPVDAGDTPVPEYRRQAYAFVTYTKTRASEAEAVTAADVDLVHGTITIAKQADRTSKGRKGTKRTKTRKVRTIDIEPNLRPLLERLVAEPQGKGGRLLHMPPPEDRAELLRKDLWTVGARRPALHESNELERAIVFHDLRDSGLVHMAVRGDSPIVIQWTAGHSDFQQTQGYIDRGRVERQRIGEPLPPLPLNLWPDPPPTGLDPRLDLDEPSSENPLDSVAFRRPQRELKAT